MLYSFLKEKNLLEQFYKECFTDNKDCETIIKLLSSEDGEGISQAFPWSESQHGFDFWDTICTEYDRTHDREKIDVKEIQQYVLNMFNAIEEEFEYEYIHNKTMYKINCKSKQKDKIREIIKKETLKWDGYSGRRFGVYHPY